jgi:3-deoxy-D-manno-octulosonic-acid transferase
MERLWIIVYNLLAVPALWVMFHLAALFDPKVRRGIRGRRGLFDDLERQVSRLTNSRRLWFHSSSLGEFEQAKPIIHAIRRRFPHVDIVVSFFSPSGYEHSRSYKLANVITYLPFDSFWNARRFVDLVKPSAAIFVRYDVWPNHVWRLRRCGVPSLIANATMRAQTSRRLPVLRSFHRHMYNALDAILTVSQSDARGYERLGLTRPRLEVVGDTRYDQVWMRSQEARAKHLIPESIVRGKKILVVGSSWEGDERIILPAFVKVLADDPALLLVIVPHEPSEENLERIEGELDHLCPDGRAMYIRFSDLNEYQGERVIIVDSVGILVSLYSYALVAYVGGGFLANGGVHNVLEPAVFGIPVLYGPNHENSQESIELLKRGGGFIVKDKDDFCRSVQSFLNEESVRAEAGKRAYEFVYENTGATEHVIRHLQRYLS